MTRHIAVWTGLACAIVVTLAAECEAQPAETKPTKEHELLRQFAGEWTAVAEAVPAPGQPAIRAEGTESSKMLGGYWYVSQGEASMMGTPVTSQLTIGYDPAAKHYVGTFVCSADSTLWKYTGQFDESGKKLTLEAEGPSVIDPAKKAKYRETLELKAPDHKIFTSYIQGADGEWTKIVSVDYKRKS
jgi:hypothetical protein